MSNVTFQTTTLATAPDATVVETQNQGSGVQRQVVQIGPEALGGLSEVAINVASSGDNTLVAAVAAKKTRVYRLFLVCAGAVNISFKDGSTVLTGSTMKMTSGGAITFIFDSYPWFTGSTNTDFIINLSGNIQVSGRLYYIQS